MKPCSVAAAVLVLCALASAVAVGVVGVVLWIVRARRSRAERPSDEVAAWTF